MVNFIRIILTLWLIYMTYSETGIYTSLALFLIFLSIEGLVILMKQTKRRIDNNPLLNVLGKR